MSLSWYSLPLRRRSRPQQMNLTLIADAKRRLSRNELIQKNMLTFRFFRAVFLVFFGEHLSSTTLDGLADFKKALMPFGEVRATFGLDCLALAGDALFPFLGGLETLSALSTKYGCL
jgi:hypothetical protein